MQNRFYIIHKKQHVQGHVVTDNILLHTAEYRHDIPTNIS